MGEHGGGVWSPSQLDLTGCGGPEEVEVPRTVITNPSRKHRVEIFVSSLPQILIARRVPDATTKEGTQKLAGLIVQQGPKFTLPCCPDNVALGNLQPHRMSSHHVGLSPS